jgi:general secretion pathway protein J
MNSRHGEQHGEAGFTLLELLVSITILGLLLVALSGGVHFAGSAWRAQEEQISRRSDMNAAQTVLRQMLASGRDFDGGPRNLKFVSKMPAALARGGLFDIDLHTDGDRLLISWRPHFKGTSTTPRQDSAVLMDGVLDLDLSYYSAQHGWQHAASDKSVELIAMRARLSDGGPWPALLISPAINGSPSSKP